MKKYIVLNDEGYPTFPIYFEGDNIPSTAIPMTDDDEYHYLSNEYKVNGEWVKAPAEPIPIEQLKQAKLSELKQARDSEEVSPLNNFDVDEKSLSRIDIAGKILATGTIPNIEWTMADNSVETINSKNIGALYVALALRSNELHEKYRTLKEQVEKAKTSEEVSKVMWND